ncbi:MAG: response regulator [Deltaproteobacteria bacterium]|nr:response regulator [Deltaproteobacteria bacterium]MBW1928252.1 response regulator [Deltaproteobacteria bacterium]MBW2025956.1 response regulator [Deltaproteobacteria bacterium]MBW2125608.1 response regulator [Deltaproteobacteria bacterium]RLB21907.1 MAG: response regulator [Deltaproteobacteria bacterium]
MSKRILIIDDDPDVVVFLSTLLQDHGYETLEAADGLQGLEITKSEHPDLILMDLMMPQKSGISLLSELKQDEELKKIPVIMVTGVSGETGIDLESFFQRATQANNSGKLLKPEGYVEKPVDPDKLLGMLDKLLA